MGDIAKPILPDTKSKPYYGGQAKPKETTTTSTAGRNQLSDMESGHSLLEAAANPTESLSGTGLNWSLIVAVAGLVLTLFWILKRHH
jgi:hypothetical protein